MKNSQIRFIQALRGLAALGVVVCHARNFLPNATDADYIWHYLIWGAGGVDLFFVISGFIMVYTTQRATRATVGEFALKRFAKIWPTYLILTLLWVFVARGGFEYLHNSHRVFIQSMLFQPIIASDPMYIGARDMSLQVGWTLNYEVYFYIVFGLSMLFGRARWLVFFAWMLATLIGLPYLTNTLTVDPNVPSSFGSAYVSLMVNPIIWNFVAGVIIALIYVSPIKLSARAAGVLTLAALSVTLWGYMLNIVHANGVLGWGGFSIAIMLALTMLAKGKEVRAPQFLVELGNVSFTLYLVHESVFELVTRAAVYLGVGNTIHTFAHVVITTTASIVAALVIGPLLEQNLTRFVLGLFRRQNTQTLTAAPAAVNVGQ